MRFPNAQQVHMLRCAFRTPRTLTDAAKVCGLSMDFAKCALRLLLLKRVLVETIDGQGRPAYVEVVCVD